MSVLPKTLELDRLGIDRLPEPLQTKTWLRILLDRLEEIHKIQRDEIETLIKGTSGTLSDPELIALAGLVSAADKLPYFTGSGSASLCDLTAFARTILAVASEAAFKALVNLEIGTDVQAYDADLDWLAANITTAGKALLDDANAAAQIATLGLDADLATFSLPASTSISDFIKTLLDDADSAAARVTLGIPVAGQVVQVVNYQTGAVATGTTPIPQDDTIPQNTEGDEYMTLTITPTSATNKLKIDVICAVSHSVNTKVTIALFQDSIANALACIGTAPNTQLIPVAPPLSHYMLAGTISATTFKVRAGGLVGAGGTLTFNGSGGGRIYGGVCASSITITEIQV